MDRMFSWWPWKSQVNLVTNSLEQLTTTSSFGSGRPTISGRLPSPAIPTSTAVQHQSIKPSISISIRPTTSSTSPIPSTSSTSSIQSSLIPASSSLVTTIATISTTTPAITTSTTTSTTKATIFSTIISNEIYNETIEFYGNISILPENPFFENELLFNVLWNNSTTEQYENDLFFPNGIVGSGSTNITSNISNYDKSGIVEETSWQLVSMVVIAIVLGFVILSTIIGNVFVIAAILLERNLQSVANHLILSLAVADLLVACLVMPLGAVYEVSQEWNMGPELCDMWTSSDVLCCTASILHLVAIALDRYWAVTNIDYVHQRTSKRIGIMIAVIWILSFLVSIAPLLGWKDSGWHTRVEKDLKCIVSQDIGYQIFATASSFYVPLLVILVLYWRIFQTARKRIRKRQQVVNRCNRLIWMLVCLHMILPFSRLLRQALIAAEYS